MTSLHGSRKEFALDDALRILGRTPFLLDAWLRDLPADWLASNEGGDSWSPSEVLGHLIHGEKTDWIPRARRILEHGAAVPFDPFDRQAQRRQPARSVGALLDEFATLRASSLASLERMALDAADLERPGMHPSLGPVTMRHLLACWVAHDLDHVMQIARVLANQYADEVGPWRAYLRIISGQPG